MRVTSARSWVRFKTSTTSLCCAPHPTFTTTSQRMSCCSPRCSASLLSSSKPRHVVCPVPALGWAYGARGSRQLSWLCATASTRPSLVREVVREPRATPSRLRAASLVVATDRGHAARAGLWPRWACATLSTRPWRRRPAGEARQAHPSRRWATL